MSAAQLSEVLIYLGVIGVLQFASLTFCTYQLRTAASDLLPTDSVVLMRKRLAGPVSRHAGLLTVVSAVTLLVGVCVSI